jgi:hypothetical protein
MDPARFPVFLDRFRGWLRSFPPLLLQSGLLAAFVAFDTGLDLLCALSSSLLLSFYIRLGSCVGISR